MEDTRGNNDDDDVNYTQSQIVGKYVEEEDEVEDEEEEQEEEEEEEETNVGDNGMNESAQQNRNEDDDDDDDNDNRFEDDGEDHSGRKRNEIVNLHRHPKKRKLTSLLASYELAPRVPPPTSTRKPSFGGRNTLTDWTEHETFVLLEAWGSRYVKCGRKSLRSEEWQAVADRVSQESKMVRTDTQCRNRLDTLKKKYKKEKANLKGGGVDTKWVYFKKMDMLLSPGGNASINPSVNPNNSNGVYETRGSSGNSDHHEGDDDNDDDDDLLPPKISKPEASIKLLADSINRFTEMYEKIENGKIQQMIELEKMRMDFHRDLEMQKKQLLDRVQADITKVQGDYEDNDISAENVSG